MLTCVTDGVNKLTASPQTAGKQKRCLCAATSTEEVRGGGAARLKEAGVLLQPQQQRLQAGGSFLPGLRVHLQQHLLQHQQQRQTHAQQLKRRRVVLAVVPQVLGEGPRCAARAAAQTPGAATHGANHIQGPAQAGLDEPAEGTCWGPALLIRAAAPWSLTLAGYRLLDGGSGTRLRRTERSATTRAALVKRVGLRGGLTERRERFLCRFGPLFSRSKWSWQYNWPARLKQGS